jgi:hypothetical protein
VQTGSYEELITSSSSFNRLLENIHQQEHEEQELLPGIDYRPSSRCVTFSEIENDEILSASTYFETKQEGSVHWRVYISYLQAGAGLILSVFLITVVFGAREATSVFYSWWLAEWSDDEGHRYRHLDNCTGTSNQFVDAIRSMNDTEWNYYQQRTFYIYSGLFMRYINFRYI